MGNGENHGAAPDAVVGASEDFEPAAAGQDPSTVADDEIAHETSLENVRRTDGGLCLRKSSRAFERIDPEDDPLDDDRGAEAKVLVGEGQEGRRGEPGREKQERRKCEKREKSGAQDAV